MLRGALEVEMAVEPLPAWHLPRPRLDALLEPTGDQRLVIVRAPAGYGKTTAVAAWLARTGVDPAWVSVDRADAGLPAFWAAVATALEGRWGRPYDPSVRSALALPPEVGPVPRLAPLLAALRAEAPGCTAAATLVVDDAEHVDAGVERSLEHFLGQAPPSVRTVVVSRRPLALPRSRWQLVGRARGVTAPDLHVTGDEAVALGARLGVAPDRRSELAELAEGWVAAVVLLAGGRPAAVGDYLEEQLLPALAPSVRRFALLTADLPFLAADLCVAATGTSSEVVADALLALQRDGSLVLETDGVLRWRRLVREHLVVRARLLVGPAELRAASQRRAAGWLESAGRADAAVDAYLAADDPTAAGRVAARAWPSALRRGDLDAAARWSARFPADVITADPRLALLAAWTGLLTGRLDDVRPHLAAAAQSAGTRTSVAAAHALHERLLGHLDAAVRRAESAWAGEPDPTSSASAVAATQLGAALVWQGRWAEAATVLGPAATAAQAAGDVPTAVTALAHLAVARAETGAGLEAVELARRATALAAGCGVAHAPATRLAHAVAGTRPTTRTARSPIGADWDPYVTAFVAVHAAADPAAARAALDSLTDPGFLAARVGVVRATRVRPQPGAELTASELRVLGLLGRALSQQEMARTLFVSRNTVKTHVSGIYRKLGVGTRSAALWRARELGLV